MRCLFSELPLSLNPIAQFVSRQIEISSAFGDVVGPASDIVAGKLKPGGGSFLPVDCAALFRWGQRLHGRGGYAIDRDLGGRLFG